MEAYTGSICAFGFNFAPYGWALCQGQLMPISQNTALFSLIGTYYGGNGTSTFGLPNLQGYVANCQGQLTGGSNYIIGENGGSENVAILSSNLPAHTHTLSFAIKANNTAKSTANPSGAFPGLQAATEKLFNTAATNAVFMKPPTVTLGLAGGSSPVNISDPSLVMNYCIALQGLFPTRN